VVRAGAGMFYANTDADPLFRLAASLPANIAQTLNSDNYIPRFDGFDVFGSTFVGQAQLQAAGIDKNQKTSYTVQGSLSVQYELKKGVVIETGYIGTLGLKLEQNVQPNNAQPGLGAVDPRRPFAGVVYAAGTKFPDYLTVVGNSVPIGLINYLPHSAQSNYHSMYVRFEKRFSHGLSWLSSYTWSKAITNAPQFRNAGGANGSENSPAQDSFNLQAERALASFHVAHRAVNTFLYELPFGKKGIYFQQGLGSKLLGGWEISGILSAQTGFPYTVNLKGDTAGVGAGTGGIFIRPNLVPGTAATLTSASRSTDRWFNINAFSAPAAGAFGSVGRNTMIGPGLTNVDMVLARVIPVTERFHLQLRGEVFNVLNHSNYNIVGRILNDPTFGRVLSQLDPRQVQFGAKLMF
jgi:hypothetical protein